MNAEQSEDPQRRSVRQRLENIRIRGARASSWRETTGPLRSLINREGYVPISAKLTGGDLDFLATAREDLLCLAELGIRLLDLHQPRDAGGITSDTANPILRCRSCMWRWPCPTFRAMYDAFSPESPRTPRVSGGLGPPGSPGVSALPVAPGSSSTGTPGVSALSGVPEAPSVAGTPGMSASSGAPGTSGTGSTPGVIAVPDDVPPEVSG